MKEEFVVEETENIQEEVIEQIDAEAEILELETLENAQENIEEEKKKSVEDDVPVDDIWNIGKISKRKSDGEAQKLRFAEDIEGIRGGDGLGKKGKKERTKAKTRKGNSNRRR